MTSTNFSPAVQLRGIQNAYARRAAGALAHRVVDAEVLVGIAELFGDTLARIRAPVLFKQVKAIEALIDNLPDTARQKLIKLLAQDRCVNVWRPFPGPQSDAWESTADLLMLAGGAGSSKSDAAIAKALYQHRQTRFLRRTSLEFSSIQTRIAEIVGSTDGLNRSSQIWRLPPPWGVGGKGAVLEFTSLSDPDAELKLQGRPSDLLVCDEAPNIPRHQISYVSRWVRTVEQGVPTQIIYTANPVANADALYLRDELFAAWLSPDYKYKKAVSGEVRFFARLDGVDTEVADASPVLNSKGDSVTPSSRQVITSTVLDNPYYMATGYMQQLQAGDALQQARLLRNDWTAGWDAPDPQAVFPAAAIDAAMRRWREPVDVLMTALGVDPSAGGDEFVIAPRHGNTIDTLKVFTGSIVEDGPKGAAAVMQNLRNNAPIYVDATGDAAVASFLTLNGARVYPVIFSSSATALDSAQLNTFVRLRSQIAWKAREWLLSNTDAMLPPDQELRRQLLAFRWEQQVGGIAVLPQSDLLKRLGGQSPDRAWAVILAVGYEPPPDGLITHEALQRSIARSLHRELQRELSERE